MPNESPQVNQLTAYIDASQVYGSDPDLASHLRNLTNELGRLREGPALGYGKPLLPFNNGLPVDCRRKISSPFHIGIRICLLSWNVQGREKRSSKHIRAGVGQGRAGQISPSRIRTRFSQPCANNYYLS